MIDDTHRPTKIGSLCVFGTSAVSVYAVSPKSRPAIFRGYEDIFMIIRLNVKIVGNVLYR